MTGRMIGAKRCTRCGEMRMSGDFSPNDNTRDGRQSWCKPCYREYRRSQHVKDPERRKAERMQAAAYDEAERRLRKAHPEEFQRLYAEEKARLGIRPYPDPEARA